VTRGLLDTLFRGQKVLVLADRPVDDSFVQALLESTSGALLVVPSGDPRAAGEVEQTTYASGDWPLIPAPRAFEWLRQTGSRTALFLHPRQRTAVGVLWRLHRAGVSEVVFLEGLYGWRRRSLLSAIALNAVSGVAWRAERMLGLDERRLTRRAQDFWERSLASPVGAHDAPSSRVAHYMASLGPGGPPRQLTNVAAGTALAGAEVAVFTAASLTGHWAHYVEKLQRAGIACRAVVARPLPNVFQMRPESQRLRWDLIERLPPGLQRPVFELAYELADWRPQVLHCWADLNNVVGALAAHVADVPVVVLALRNLRATALDPRSAWVRDWYRALARSPRVVFVANAAASVEDHVRWLGVPSAHFLLVRNGVDTAAMKRPGSAMRAAFRESLDLPANAPVVAGVFRLDQVKRPLDFLDVVDEVRRRLPELRAVIAGTGRLQQEVERAVASRGLAPVVRLLGERSDVDVVLGSCDVCLHPSASEASPNVVQEAQCVGTPVVATNVGGTGESLADGESGFLCRVGDVRTMANRVEALLRDSSLRERMGAVGRERIHQHYALPASLQGWWAAYEALGWKRPMGVPEATPRQEPPSALEIAGTSC
jgi:glycosyltransferase involved in cell wall biosynthesis